MSDQNVPSGPTQPDDSTLPYPDFSGSKPAESAVATEPAAPAAPAASASPAAGQPTAVYPTEPQTTPMPQASLPEASIPGTPDDSVQTPAPAASPYAPGAQQAQPAQSPAPAEQPEQAESQWGAAPTPDGYQAPQAPATWDAPGYGPATTAQPGEGQPAYGQAPYDQGAYAQQGYQAPPAGSQQTGYPAYDVTLDQQTRQNSMFVLILALAGIFFVPLIPSIIAWVWGNSVIKTAQQAQLPADAYSLATGGKIIGIIFTILWGALIVLGLIALVFFVIVAGSA